MEIKELDFDARKFGECVRALRTQKGWTTTKLADEAGISRPYMWQLEEGRSSPSLGVATRIAKALGVQVTDFFGTSEDISQQADQSDQIVFWNFLCERAATVQKVFRLEREFPVHQWYRLLLEHIDRSLIKSPLNDECVQQTMEAIKIEMKRWGENLGRDEYGYGAMDSVQAWRDAISLAESRLDRQQARLPLYWNLGNALYGPKNYRYPEAFDALKMAETYLSTSRMDAAAIAGFKISLGWVSYYTGEFQEGEKYFKDVIKFFEEMPEDTLANSNTKFNNLSGVNRGLAAIYQRQMRFTDAERYFQYSLENARKVKKDVDGQLQLIWVNFRIGSFYRFIGDLQKSQTFLGTARKLLEEHSQIDSEEDFGLSALKTMVLNNLADQMLRDGKDLDSAEESLEESQRNARKIDDPRSLAYSYLFSARFYLASGNTDKSLYCLDEASRQFQRMKIPRYLDEIEITRTKLYYSLGLVESAKGVIDAIDETQNQDKSIQSLVGITRAMVYSKDKQKKNLSRGLFEKHLVALKPMKYDLVEGLLEYSKYLIAEKDIVTARARLNEALIISTDQDYSKLRHLVSALLNSLRT